MTSTGRYLSLLALLLLRCNDFLITTSAFSPTPSLAIRARSSSTASITGSSRSSSTATTTATARNAVPSSVVELTDPETGCQVLLLGCFHGSNSSASDVQQIIDVDTDVVVLELCASRFADLRRDMLLAQAQAQASSSATSSEQEMDICIDEVPVAVEAKKPKRPWILRYASTVASTARERGIGAGLAFAVLGGVSGLQTSLSGLIPGLEFTTALQAATQVHADIVLADQVVEDTLNNIGNLPATSVRMWRDLLQTGSWHDTFGKEAAALQTAIAGNSKFQPHQLTLPAFLTRSKVSLEEGIRSTVPPFLLLQLFAASANTVAEQVVNPAVATAAFAADVAVSASLPVTADPTTPESLALNVFNFAVLAIGYISVALPAARVVLRERDDQLTAGIQQACRLAVQSKGKGRLGINSSTPPKVVAVLGLLHVNGVAQRILSAAATPQTGAMPRITSREILGERSLVQGDGASS